ncbi:hypothetical protein J2W83_004971 [Pseudomonas hunanensis]|uniref:Uncharacterized protein n=1 Tax=Pseudomonas hunanensis TaxID=1247546 RepID=A0ACC6KA79_9PSED|nr:hypothetical protein [Pseudomonas sp. BP8]MDR6715329.1 hypothetical protein [Pseudomonas hunanensis]
MPLTTGLWKRLAASPEKPRALTARGFFWGFIGAAYQGEARAIQCGVCFACQAVLSWFEEQVEQTTGAR